MIICCDNVSNKNIYIEKIYNKKFKMINLCIKSNRIFLKFIFL